MIPLVIKKHKRDGVVISEQRMEIPCLWEEVTLRQFLEIITAKQLDAFALLSILTGFSIEFLKQVPASAIEDVSRYIFFIYEPPKFDDWKMPKEYWIDGKPYKVPTDLKKETWGQKIMAQQELNEMIENKRNVLEPLPYVLACYFYPAVTGDKNYTDEKIRAFIPKILDTPVTQAYPIGSFFLSKLIQSLKLKNKRLTFLQLKSRLQQVSGILTSSA